MTRTAETLQTTAPAASVVAATKQYGSGDTTVRALDDLSVDIARGRFTAILGPSGSGKSTLLHCLAGLDTLTTGQVWIGDTEIGALSDRDLTVLRRDRIGFVFQAFNLVPTLTAHENMVLPLRLAGARLDAAWLDELIDTLDLSDRLRHRPAELSGGQQQRVALARALVTRPELVVADEPTGDLDSRTGETALRFLQDAVRDLGQTVVMVTHDPVAAGYADHAVFLKDGRVAGEMDRPSAERVLDHIKKTEAGQ